MASTTWMKIPARAARGIFTPLPVLPRRGLPLHHVTSCLAAVLLAALVWLGFTGSRDPLANPFPLFVWTVWWIGLVTVQGLIGNHWRWTNPWTGPAALLGYLMQRPALWQYPRWLGYAPGIVIFLAFAALLLADPAPADPARLATVVSRAR